MVTDTTTPRRSRRTLFLVVAAIALVALVAGGAALWVTRAGGTDPAADPTPTAAPVDALPQACRDAVKQRLKAPGSAQFGGESHQDGPPPGWTARGWVDSQNGFGALIRQRFLCRAERGLAWRVTDVQFSAW